MMFFKIILPTLFSVYLIGSPTLSASSPLNTEQLENLFDSVNACYEKNKENLTPKILAQIEEQLNLIIGNQNTSHDILANTAYLLFTIDCETSYLKAMNTLFYRRDFNAPLYRSLMKYINELRKVKAAEEEQRRQQRFEEQQRSVHVDPQAEITAPPQIADQKKGKKKPKKPQWHTVR
jgi:Sec-independent protein translocase protein TatA